MKNYNEKWTRQHYLEYCKLKRKGYSHEQLKNYFGENIWYSGIYNKNANILPWLDFINEIKINPFEIPYKRYELNSLFYENEIDYYAEFDIKNNKYVICLLCYYINGIKTYNITFTTKEQFDFYYEELNRLLDEKKYITEEDRLYLKSIFEKETNFNEIYDIMKRLSFIILDIYNKKIKGDILSLSDTDNYIKIELYKNIIKSSFENITEDLLLDENENKYYVYKIN